MTIRRKLTVAALVTFTVAAVALFLSLAPKAQAQGQGRSLTLSGTIYGSLDFAYPGGPAWVGYALISFDKQAPLKATFVDKGWHEFKPNGGMIGGETIKLTFDGGTFEILGRFESNMGSTPGMAYLHETRLRGQRDRRIHRSFRSGYHSGAGCPATARRGSADVDL